LVVPFVLGGIGMALVFAPAANAVLSAVRPAEAGQASGATNAIREIGGVFGVAVLASVFSGAGSYASPQAFNDGPVAAAWVVDEVHAADEAAARVEDLDAALVGHVDEAVAADGDAHRVLQRAAAGAPVAPDGHHAAGRVQRLHAVVGRVGDIHVPRGRDRDA